MKKLIEIFFLITAVFIANNCFSAEPQRMIKEELKFREDDNLKAKYFAASDYFKKNDEATQNYIAKSKVYFAEYDLNEDGINEYIVKVKTEKEICPRSDMPSCINITVYDRDFNHISSRYGGYIGDVLISNVKTNNYYDVLLKCRKDNKRKFTTLFYNPKYKEYDNSVKTGKGTTNCYY